MNKSTFEMINRLTRAGISDSDAWALRRISMTLRQWFEHECNGHIQRDEETDRPHSYYMHQWGCPARRGPVVPDREAGARKRLAAIMARYPGWMAYVQSDPRGCAVRVLPPDTIERYGITPETIDSRYDHGIAVYK